MEDHDLAQREVLDVRRRRGQRDVAPREYRGLDKPPLRCLKDVFARSVVLLDEIECPVAEEDGRRLRRDNVLPRSDADSEEDRSIDGYVPCTARSCRRLQTVRLVVCTSDSSERQRAVLCVKTNAMSTTSWSPPRARDRRHQQTLRPRPDLKGLESGWPDEEPRRIDWVIKLDTVKSRVTAKPLASVA